MAKKVRWGLLSTANINKALIGPLQQAERSELVAVASRDSAKASAYAKAHGIPKAHGSYEALLADPEIDAIYNPLPNLLHREWTVKAADAGLKMSGRLTVRLGFTPSASPGSGVP